MAVVSSVVVNPGGKPVHGATVAVALVTGSNVPGFEATKTVVGVAKVTTKADGSWSVDLTPNASIVPASTYYRVTEKIGPSVSSEYSIIVPASGGPFSVRDILAAPPPAGEQLIPAAVMVARVWNGSAYVPAIGATHYVGPNDPGSAPDGSIWDDTA